MKLFSRLMAKPADPIPSPPKWALDQSWPQNMPRWRTYTPHGLPTGAINPSPVSDDKLCPGEITAAQVSEVARAMALAFAFVVAKSSRLLAEISVLDFGGALGGHYRIARNAIPECKINYTVQELPELCEVGRKARPDVLFVSDKADLEDSYDLVVASGALQYVQDWKAQLSAFAKMAKPWLYVARVMVFDDETKLLCEEGEISVWGFGRAEFLSAAQESGLVLADEFAFQDDFDTIRGTAQKPKVRGFLFRRAR